MVKQTSILLVFVAWAGFCHGQQSFVMQCYYKKYSDTTYWTKAGDYIRDYRRCLTCREEYENRKIAQKVYMAQLTGETAPIRSTKYGPDYYRYYRSVVSRKYYSRTLAAIIDAL